jgi:hypothetical protein
MNDGSIAAKAELRLAGKNKYPLRQNPDIQITTEETCSI